MYRETFLTYSKIFLVRAFMRLHREIYTDYITLRDKSPQYPPMQIRRYPFPRPLPYSFPAPLSYKRINTQ